MDRVHRPIRRRRSSLRYPVDRRRTASTDVLPDPVRGGPASRRRSANARLDAGRQASDVPFEARLELGRLADEHLPRLGRRQPDLIIAVDGVDVIEKGYSDAINSIAQGEEGSEIALSINRGGDELEITVTRRRMEITSVTGQMLDGNIAYIKIDSFNEKTGTQFSQVLYKLLNDGAERIVFDVRNNGGGLVSAVDEVLEDVLPKGEVAFATYNDGEKIPIVTMENDNEISIPMVVLVNNSTASGGELFAQALRDFASVPLVGTTTYGKGVMQTTYELEGGGAVTITVATYQTTKTDCYDGIGIVPDFEIELSEEAQSYIEGVDTENDFQLIKAIEVVTTG